MIGVFDSGHGGLTILKALSDKFPDFPFLYLGDHANVPYGNRSSDEVVALTKAGVEQLFERGCRLVILGCNTATAIACRSLQQDWLPNSAWQGRNVVGIIAPTVEVATQTPWGVTEPQYPQMYKEDLIAVFATERTIQSSVYTEEIKKRCPNIEVVGQVCSELAGLIEAGAEEAELDELIETYIAEMMQRADGRLPHWAILGCTHFPMVEGIFARHLPSSCRVLSQPTIVAQALEHYLQRHPHYVEDCGSRQALQLFTTGDVEQIEERLIFAWRDRPRFQGCSP